MTKQRRSARSSPTIATRRKARSTLCAPPFRPSEMRATRATRIIGWRGNSQKNVAEQSLTSDSDFLSAHSPAPTSRTADVGVYVRKSATADLRRESRATRQAVQLCLGPRFRGDERDRGVATWVDHAPAFCSSEFR